MATSVGIRLSNWARRESCSKQSTRLNQASDNTGCNRNCRTHCLAAWARCSAKKFSQLKSTLTPYYLLLLHNAHTLLQFWTQCNNCRTHCICTLSIAWVCFSAKTLIYSVDIHLKVDIPFTSRILKSPSLKPESSPWDAHHLHLQRVQCDSISITYFGVNTKGKRRNFGVNTKRRNFNATSAENKK